MNEVYCMDARNGVLIPELSHTVQAKASGGRSLNCTPNVIYAQESRERSPVCLTPWDSQGNQVWDAVNETHFPTLRGQGEAGYQASYIIHAAEGKENDERRSDLP